MRALGSANAAADDSCAKLPRMAAAPTAMTTATKHASMNIRIVSLLFLSRLPHFRTPGFVWRTMSLAEIRYSGREGKGLHFHVDEDSPERAHGSVKVSRSGVFQIDKKAPDPGGEMVFEELTIGVGRARNISADQACHDLAE